MTEIVRKLEPASSELVNATQAVVDIALKRVREGRLGTGSAKTQTVFLEHPETHRLYRITDSDVKKEHEGVVSKGWLNGGLSISAIELDKSGKPLEKISGIELPRNTVTPDNIVHLAVRGRTVAELNGLEVSLREAEAGSDEKYALYEDQIYQARRNSKLKKHVLTDMFAA